jgi:hypothetical protein
LFRVWPSCVEERRGMRRERGERQCERERERMIEVERGE